MNDNYRKYQEILVSKNFGSCENEKIFNKGILYGKTIQYMVNEWEKGYSEQDGMIVEMVGLTTLDNGGIVIDSDHNIITLRSNK